MSLADRAGLHATQVLPGKDPGSSARSASSGLGCDLGQDFSGPDWVWGGWWVDGIAGS